MHNEPVAWIDAKTGKSKMKGWVITDHDIPLYTHPPAQQWTIDVKVKELTDEEIDELANKHLYVLNDVPYANDIKDFARAILRKAQE